MTTSPLPGLAPQAAALSAALILGLAGCTPQPAPQAGTGEETPTPAEPLEGPRLVLQITVDQLRGDTVSRFRDRFGERGFRTLLDHGVHYLAAHYAHANTETAPGHATLATGAYPSRHGIVSNDWVDRASGEFVYNTEDERHHLLGVKKRKPHKGVSPRNLLTSTFSDELVASSGGRSRAFSVSVKDRGAILPGGHRGKAFWYSKSSGRFLTSSYYYEQEPAWLTAWNATKPFAAYAGKTWELLHPRASYLAAKDDRACEVDFHGLGRTFPHSFGKGRALPAQIGLTPMGDELALDLALKLVEVEKIGQGKGCDYLGISFSSPDYSGHLFGGASLEYEDAVLRIDALLGKLFARLDEVVGLDRVLIVLSADHGGPDSPEFHAEGGLPTGRFELSWLRDGTPDAALKKALQAKFGRVDLILKRSHPYVYLNRKAIAEANLEVGVVAEFVADHLEGVPGIAYAITRADVEAATGQEGTVPAMVRHGFHPRRSGDIYLVQDPHWLLHSTREADALGIPTLPAIHGSPWAYDTHVPILFAGPGVPHRTVARRVGPQDIACTLSAYMGIKPPSGSVGLPLVEVLQGFSAGAPAAGN
jgi:predicted AlkP superfamily pyrophosphatase or phosphodiesterase